MTVAKYTNSYKFGSSLIGECCLNQNKTRSSFSDCFNNKKRCIQLKYLKKQLDTSSLCKTLRKSVGSEGYCPVTLIDSSPASIWNAAHWAEEPANKGIRYF